ncbi:nitroreductase family protein [Brevibacillus ginsengisoli]|uniref:nitroreductase family protein n=1 Tax=Brevibacillus ginsengisoli TaxID=363854 RepID=UPI003CF63800
MNQFEEVVKTRRSANKFIKGVEIPASELEAIFSLVKFAPSAFNLQHTRYLVVNDPEVKERIYEEAAYKQYKVHTASAVILVLGDKLAYQRVGELNQGMRDLGIISKQEYDYLVSDVTNMYESRGEGFQRDEAIRNASLSAMQLMLIAKEKGWDTCPMIGFDPEGIKKLLNIPDQFEPVLMITIGKEDTSSQRARGYRKPVGEFVSFNTFA